MWGQANPTATSNLKPLKKMIKELIQVKGSHPAKATTKVYVPLRSIEKSLKNREEPFQ
jgi:hypothetical protein